MRITLKFMLALLLSASLLLLVACGGDKEEDVSSSPYKSGSEETLTEESKAEYEKRKLEEEQARAKAHQEEMERDIARRIAEVEAILADSFEGVAVISFNPHNKTFEVLPTEQEFVDDLDAMVLGIMLLDEWYEVVDALTDLSSTVSEYLDRSYGLVLINPSNTNNMLMWLQDGEVLYEAFEENSDIEELDKDDVFTEGKKHYDSYYKDGPKRQDMDMK